MANWNPAITIPLTKLWPPQSAEGTLDRARLVGIVYEAATTKRLTLIAAPAGAGKTTAVVAFHQSHPELPLAWAALDEGDDSPHAFLQLFIAAVRRHISEYGRQVQEILESGADNAPDWMRLMGALVNDMVLHIYEPFIIVLDDLHRVSHKTIHDLLDYLLERMPANIHLIIATRHDPPLRLAQLRAAGQMTEFRLDSLRFSAEEIAGLFNEGIGLNLTPTDLQLVYERTEGWAAGVRLLALSLPRLESADKRSDLIQHLSASHRFLFDYLMEEVLNQLAAPDRDFLLQTAVLDELTPTLCNAVTGRGDAAITLRALYRQNLFLIVSETTDPLAEPSYRTHSLFAQFLQKQLRQQPEMNSAALHLRAAEAETSPERRIHHLLAARSWDAASEAIIAIGKIQCDREFVRPAVTEWIGRIPAEVRQQHYWLDLIEASYLSQKGRFFEAWQLCKAVLPLARARGDVAGELEALWTLSRLVTEQPEPQWGNRFAELAAERSDLLSPARRTFYLMSRAFRAFNQDGWPAAQRYFYDFIEAVRAAEDKQLYYAVSQRIAPVWLFADYGLPLIQHFDQEIFQRFGEEDGLVQAGPYSRRGWIALLQGDLDTAEASARRASRIARLWGGLAFMDLTVDLVLLMVMVARSDFERLEVFVREAESRLQKLDTLGKNVGLYWFALWRTYWLQDRRVEYQAVMTRLIASLDEIDTAESPTISIMEGWQAYTENRPLLAEQKLMNALRRHRELRYIGTWGNPGMDLALFYMLEGRRSEALAVWCEAAVEMQKREMPGQPLFTGRKAIPVLEAAVQENVYPEIAQVSLNAFGLSTAPRPLAIPYSSEVLTAREAEVLELLMAGATNQEIADRLVITKRTAKAHVSHILQKLQVSSRTEAVARAYELSLR